MTGNIHGFASVDARTGREVERVGAETSPAELDDLCARAAVAARELSGLGRAGRARLLRSMARSLEERRADLVAVADRETALGEQRLNGELTRTCYQLDLFADVAEDGAYLEATIDHAGETPMGPRPDLRRMLVPLGPVAVFGASNFPFAFSVPGGDTASALSAGCPVIAKVHTAHPATSVLSHEALVAGARAAGVTPDVINLVWGREAGVGLVGHPAVQAVGFTGSLGAGRTLFDVASTGRRRSPSTASWARSTRSSCAPRPPRRAARRSPRGSRPPSRSVSGSSARSRAWRCFPPARTARRSAARWRSTSTRCPPASCSASGRPTPTDTARRRCAAWTASDARRRQGDRRERRGRRLDRRAAVAARGRRRRDGRAA